MSQLLDFYVDPYNITNFHRSKGELEAFWLFCIVAAGKNAQVQSKKLADFLKDASRHGGPFGLIQHYLKEGEQMVDPRIPLEHALREVKMGQYTRILKSFYQSVVYDIGNCSLGLLESIHGVGPKTARFFLLHSRPNQWVAVLDTHILKWFKDTLGEDVPKVTPTGKKYITLEQKFLDYCQKNKIDPAELDLRIWTHYNKKIT